MNLEEVLNHKDLSVGNEIDLSNQDLVKLIWKYRGLSKEIERNKAFWASTNENLKLAYEKLDMQERELEKTYSIIREDLEVASQIQRSMLPYMNESLSDLMDVCVYHRQKYKVGGDYYDFFLTNDKKNIIGLFDISGHGVSAALLMTYLKAQFTQAIQYLGSPREIVETVNRISYHFLKKVKKYATVNFLIFDSMKIRYVCAGGYGLIIHGEQQILFQKTNNYLGLRDKPFTEFEVPFHKGDVLAIYTDGITESHNSRGEDYSAKRLNNVIAKNAEKPVNEILDICIGDYQNFRNDDHDDITLILIKKKRD